MKINVKIKEVLPKVEGVSKAGKEYVLLKFIAETLDRYHKTILLTIIGADRVSDFITNFSVDDEVEVEFDLESKKVKGVWFTDLIAWSFTRIKKETKRENKKDTQPAEQEQPVEVSNDEQTQDDNDLPF